MVMVAKRTRTARVPCHQRFAARFRPSTTTGSERKIKPNTLGRFHRVADGEMRIPQIALEDIVHRRDLPGLVLRVRRDDGDLPAGPGEVVVRSGRQAEQPLRFANIDCSI
jgi:hypothetical protein